MRWFLFLVCSLFAVSGFSQKRGVYWVHFTDKNASPYSVSSPSQFLSQRAIDRRIRQNISVVSQDIPVNPDYRDSINHIFPVSNSSKWHNGVLVTVTDSTKLLLLSGISFVESYTYVRPLFLKSNSELNDQLNAKSDYYNYALAYDQIKMLNGNELHNLGYKGDSILIAVVDAGFTGADNINIFDSMYFNNRLISTRNFVVGNNNTAVYQSSSHGTSVLSTMGGLKNDTMVGTAPHALYSLILSEDALDEYVFEEYAWACAAEYADSLGADIITSSLGYTTFNDPAMNHTWADLNGRTSVASLAATYAARKGIVVVVSAGNSGVQPWHRIGIPADADSVLTVGAVDYLEQYASFSSVGPSFDGRVKPDVAAMGASTSVVSSVGDVYQSNGTSFSCPIIAGMTACLWQAHRNSGNMEIIQAIKKSADKYNSPDTLTGYGIPDFAIANNLLSGITVPAYSEELMVNVFPNPFVDQLYVKYFSKGVTEISIEITDMFGRILFNDNLTLIPNSLNSIELNKLMNISKGIYILKVNTRTNSYKRLVVKR